MDKLPQKAKFYKLFLAILLLIIMYLVYQANSNHHYVYNRVEQQEHLYSSPPNHGVTERKRAARYKNLISTKSMSKDFQEMSTLATESPSRSLAISRTLRNIDKCMAGSNLSSPTLLQLARDNAKQFMIQYGSVISPDYLHNYTNYCWNISYSLSLSYNLSVGWDVAKGHIGTIAYSRLTPRLWFGPYINNFVKRLYDQEYASSSVCLPNIYLLGFEKSGSTFFWCLLSKMLNRNGEENERVQAVKEPYFWTPFNYKVEPPSSEKLAAHYIPIFLRGADKRLSVQTRRELAMINGCPSTVIEWPHFTKSEPELTNYCLLPSALPELFPGSKYVVIMRNPVDMLYSSFWWSFNYHDNIRTINVSQLMGKKYHRGPQLFHDQVSNKIERFLNCINNYSGTKTQPNCTLWGRRGLEFSECIATRAHLLSECVANITTKREFLEAVLHRGVYYVHVRKMAAHSSQREDLLHHLREAERRHTLSVERGSQSAEAILRVHIH